MSSGPCTYCPPPKPSVKSCQTHTGAPETFARFPKLAPEIRIKIWQLAASEPREIKLYVLSPEWMDTKMKEQTRAPAIMHTCRESREEGKRFYTVCVEKASHLHSLGWSPKYPETLSGAKSIVWVNFGIDRFVDESGYNTSFRRYYEGGFNFEKFVLQQIRHLGLANTKVSNLVWGINELYYGKVLSIKKLKSFKIIQRMSGIEHNKGCPLRELIMDKIRNEVIVNKRTWGWKVPAKIEWRSREAKRLPRRSENASVVTVDEEMIWQLEETIIL